MLARTHDGGGIDTGLLDYAWVLSRHRRTILGIAAVAAILTLVISFLLPTRWTAEAGFIPESSTSIQLPTGINALAGELGFSLPGGDPTSSPDFYAAVTESRSLLEQTLLTRFRVPGAAASDSAALIDILKIEDDNPRQRMEDGVQWMKDHSSAKVDAKTGVITLDAELPDPDLSASVVSRMVALLNEFNQRTRNLRARERRRFTEAQTNDAQRDLTAAEDNMRAFLVRNRSFENSPQLVFENQRLDRQVQIRQDIYQTLRREYEVARIDEVNNTPVLTVVDAPTPPAKPSSPRRVRMTLVALVLGLLVGATYAFVREYVSRSQELQPAAYDRLARSWSRKGAGGAPAEVATPS
ncbi:MAG TPA: GNVR domain-containing protein [Gemmatimonadales bacterium]|nr:GNVR domain-containing protein [Gemmatimonadales bacterium]